MPHLIIVNGFPRVGKDTFIAHCRMHLGLKSHPTKNVSMIDSTLDMIRSDALLSDFALNTKTAKDRKLMATVHKALLDYGDTPITNLLTNLSAASSVFVVSDEKLNDFVGFTCCREPETIDRLKAAAERAGWSITTVFVHRDTHEEIVTDADRFVTQYDYDSYILNVGSIEKLDQLALAFVNEKFSNKTQVPN